MLGEHNSVAAHEGTGVSPLHPVRQFTALVETLFLGSSTITATQGVQRVIVIVTGRFTRQRTDTDQPAQAVIVQNPPRFIL
ncbi:hypothetical protein D3C84_1169870 [compost metagenome]